MRPKHFISGLSEQTSPWSIRSTGPTVNLSTIPGTVFIIYSGVGFPLPNHFTSLHELGHPHGLQGFQGFWLSGVLKLIRVGRLSRLLKA